jgi:hypothetical protein
MLSALNFRPSPFDVSAGSDNSFQDWAEMSWDDERMGYARKYVTTELLAVGE